LLGQDTLFLLDEAHLVPPFEHLLRAVTEERAEIGLSGDQPDLSPPPSRLLALSATQRTRPAEDRIFALDASDRDHPVLQRRLGAEKHLVVRDAVTDKELSAALARGACELVERHSNARVLVFSDSREVAEKARTLATSALEKKLGKRKRGELPSFETELLVGARRVHERSEAQQRLETLGFLAGAQSTFDGPALVFATSAGEVGIDLDAHHMVSDVVPWERMVQRFGRVNRRGERPAEVIVVPSKEPFDPERAEAVVQLLEALKVDGKIDVSPGRLARLASKYLGDAEISHSWQAAFSPAPYYPALERPLVEAWAMTSLREHTGRPEVEPWLRGWVDRDPQTTVVWRGLLPRTENRSDKATIRILGRLFEAAPPHVEEHLETETKRVQAWLVKLADRASKETANAAEAESPVGVASLPLDQVVVVLLDRSDEPVERCTLQELTSLPTNPQRKKQLGRSLAGRTLVVHAALGGLGEKGLLDPKSSDTLWTPEMESAEDAAVSQAVPWTARRVRPDEGSVPEGWRATLRIPLAVDADGMPTWEMEVLRRRADEASEDEKSVSKTSQTLSQHQAWARDRATQIADHLSLPPAAATMLAEATALHDEGKAARRWQRAFNAPTSDVFAKTKGPVNTSALDGYRHELGSLTRVSGSEVLKRLGPAWHELALHLVAAHHGFTRPIISTSGFDELPPSAVEARARDAALRFLDLQAKWGPWALAWWEALLRAADIWASRDLEEGREA
jgi:CRISPR-associated endonuclease/helicase Cas3